MLGAKVFFPNDVWFEMLFRLIEFILIQILGRFNKYLCVFKTSDLLIYCIALGHSRITFLVSRFGCDWIYAHHIAQPRDNGIWRMYLLCDVCMHYQCKMYYSTERRIGSNRRAKGGTSFCCLYGNIFIDNIQLVVHICRVVRLMFYHSSTLSNGSRLWVLGLNNIDQNVNNLYAFAFMLLLDMCQHITNVSFHAFHCHHKLA